VTPDADALLRVLEDEGRRLLELAAGGLDRPVPGCPGWTVADLVAHLDGVYRWVCLIVGERRSERPPRHERAALDLTETDEQALLRAAAQAHAQVVDVLRGAPGDLDCWTVWPAPDSRYHWIRRQAHETQVHRADVQDAVTGGEVELDPVAAADGVDEVVLGFATRYPLRAPVPCTLALHATDVDRWWWLRFGDGEPEFGRGRVGDPARTDVHGSSTELLLLLWNRRGWDGLQVVGDDLALKAWRQTGHL
jgi:uncharacterized protein (TIGR03083 family)